MRPARKALVVYTVAASALCSLAWRQVHAEPHAVLATYGATFDAPRPAEAPPADPPELAGATRRFRFDQKRFLRSRHGPGAVAYVSAGTEEPRDAPPLLPVVVLLHGLNPAERVTPHLDGAADDLRPIVDALVASHRVAPFILAAPTHARFAIGTQAMWQDFDLGSFVDGVAQNVAPVARVDRTRVVVISYSGGGCNLHGGMLGAAAAPAAALVAIDTCLDAATSDRLIALSAQRPVRVYYQPSWVRDFSRLEYAATLSRNVVVQREDDLGQNPHAAILPRALGDALQVLLPGAGGGVAAPPTGN